MGRLIQRDKSVIPACDVTLEMFETIVKETADIDAIGAYKIPAKSGRKGWETWVQTARKYTDKPLIYDHQKAGTDIPSTGKDFMKDLAEAGLDAVILFPQSGPVTQKAWIEAAREVGLDVLGGGIMTHDKYLRSEGGYIADEAILEMYLNSVKEGVTSFIVPGNRPEWISKIKEAIEDAGLTPTFYAPGFVAQGGNISETTKVAGDYWHAIVGRGLYLNKAEGRYKTAEEVREAALELTSQL
jgi:orotidine-5'-phosphate decarboxylase